MLCCCLFPPSLACTPLRDLLGGCLDRSQCVLVFRFANIICAAIGSPNNTSRMEQPALCASVVWEQHHGGWGPRGVGPHLRMHAHVCCSLFLLRYLALGPSAPHAPLFSLSRTLSSCLFSSCFELLLCLFVASAQGSVCNDCFSLLRALASFLFHSPCWGSLHYMLWRWYC